jgi:hypothetical protein
VGARGVESGSSICRSQILPFRPWSSARQCAPAIRFRSLLSWARGRIMQTVSPTKL